MSISSKPSKHNDIKGADSRVGHSGLKTAALKLWQHHLSPVTTHVHVYMVTSKLDFVQTILALEKSISVSLPDLVLL